VKERTKIVHVSTWEEFKRLAIALRPEFMAYTVQNAPLSRPPIGLRLVFATQDVQYVFLDFANGNTLRRTKLPVYTGKSGDAYFKEDDLKNLIRTETESRRHLHSFIRSLRLLSMLK